MDLPGFLARRAFAIIIIWVLALGVSFPLFRSLESLTLATEESLLPKSSESSIAGAAISSISGGGGSDILYIAGINISDPDISLEIARMISSISNQSSQEVRDVGGYPSLVLQLYNNIRSTSYTAINSSTTASKMLLRVASDISSNLSYVIMVFENLSASLKYSEEVLLALDSNYTGAVDLAANLSRELPTYIEGIRILDQSYSQIYQQTYRYSQEVSKLTSSLIYNDTARSDLTRLYLFLWWQAARAIYYYNITGEGYVNHTNLTSIDPRLAPLPLNITIVIYREFRENYGEGVGADIIIANITSRILLPEYIRTQLPSIDGRSAQVIGEILYRAWLQVYEEEGSCLYCSLQPPSNESGSHIVSQLTLLNTLLSEAPKISDEIRDRGSSYIQDIIYRYIVESGASDSLARKLSMMIVSGGVNKTSIASLVVDEASRQAPNNTMVSRYAPYLVEILVTLDPDASGSIYSNQSLAREAIVILVSRIGNIDPSFATSLVDMLMRNPSRDDIASALRSYVSLVAERLSNGALSSSDLSYILEKYDPLGLGLLRERERLINASIELVQLVGEKRGYGQLIGSLPRSIIERIASEPSRVEAIAKDYFLSLSINMTSTEAKRLGLGVNASRVALQLVSYIVNSYPNQSLERIYDYIVQIISTSIVDEFGSKYHIDPHIADVIASSSLSVALGNETPEQATDLVSKTIYRGSFDELLETVRGRLVGLGNDSFIVTYVPLGEDRYESSKLFFSRVSSDVKKIFPNASVMWTGSIAIARDLETAASEDVARISRVSEILVFVVLIAVLGSLASVILPYLGIVIGVVVGGGIAYIVATSGAAEMISLTRTLIYVIPLGLGSDYAAYLVYRFREEYARLRDPKKAAEEALRRAGPAIIASALTVIAGFGSLALGWEFPLFRSLGVFMPLVVAITATSSLTLVPAVLALVGGSKWFLWGFRGLGRLGGAVSSIAMRVNRLGLLVPVIFIMISIVSLALYPSIQASHDLRLFLPSNSPSIVSLDAMASDIGYGFVFPTYVVIVKNTSIGLGDLRLIEDLSERIEKIDGVKSVEGPTRPLGEPLNITQDLLKDPYASRYISDNTTYLRIVISYNPFSQEAVDTLKKIREVSHSWGEENGYKIYIGGSTAASEELDRLVNSLFWQRVLPFAVAAMIVIFTVVFGSLPAAVLSVAIVVLSSFISMVLTGVISNRVFSTAMIWFLPQVVFTAMLGVGMDYNSFYMARAREICLNKGKCGSEEAAMATGAVGRLVVGLALVVAAAFGSLMLSSSIGLRQIGLSLLVSALLISSAASYLVAPPLLSMLGRRAWRKPI
ncbi:MAG TPA: MMPL family transporter [Sulfolobales archaeon]|nr:MMPL family transporter [Sulfolobales archaeon]